MKFKEFNKGYDVIVSDDIDNFEYDPSQQHIIPCNSSKCYACLFKPDIKHYHLVNISGRKYKNLTPTSYSIFQSDILVQKYE